jgi:hypothetical protein
MSLLGLQPFPYLLRLKAFPYRIGGTILMRKKSQTGVTVSPLMLAKSL